MSISKKYWKVIELQKSRTIRICIPTIQGKNVFGDNEGNRSCE